MWFSGRLGRKIDFFWYCNWYCLSILMIGIREYIFILIFGWLISYVMINFVWGFFFFVSFFNVYFVLFCENFIFISCWINGGVGSGGGVGFCVWVFFFCRCLDFEGFLEEDWGWGFFCLGLWLFFGMVGVGGLVGWLVLLVRNW